MKWLLTILLLFSVDFTSFAGDILSADLQEGDSIPHFSVETNDGRIISSASLKGKPALIAFFHTSCWDCRKELPDLQDIFVKYGCQMEIVAISRGQREVEVSDYWSTHNLQIPYSAQDDKRVFKLFANKTIPRVYVVDSEGIIVNIFKERFNKRKLIREIKKVLVRR